MIGFIICVSSEKKRKRKKKDNILLTWYCYHPNSFLCHSNCLEGIGIQKNWNHSQQMSTNNSKVISENVKIFNLFIFGNNIWV